MGLLIHWSYVRIIHPKNFVFQVFKTRDKVMGRVTAVKTLLPDFSHDAEFTGALRKNAAGLVDLTHPNIARIYNLGPADETPHFVMEFLDGRPLSTAAARLTWQQKAELMLKVVTAVQFLHAQGMLHPGIAYCPPQTRSIGQIIEMLLLMWEIMTPEEMRNRVEFL